MRRIQTKKECISNGSMPPYKSRAMDQWLAKCGDFTNSPAIQPASYLYEGWPNSSRSKGNCQQYNDFLSFLSLTIYSEWVVAFKEVATLRRLFFLFWQGDSFSWESMQASLRRLALPRRLALSVPSIKSWQSPALIEDLYCTQKKMKTG